MQSRLSRNLEKKTKRRLFLTILGTIILLVLLVKFGMPLLINFSLFLSGTKSDSATQATKQNKFIASPVLDTNLTATNSATVNISGTASVNESIELFVNDNPVNTVDTQNDGSFVFKNVSLNNGNNTIKAQAKKDTSQSGFSDPLVITYTNSAPHLSVDSPSDGQSFSKDQSTITVKGKADTGIRVTINDFWAIVDDNGNYSYSLHLQNGDNLIKVVATDNAGNKTEKDIKVSYSQ